MNQMSVLPVGNYANMFPVTLDSESFDLVRTSRSRFPDLKELRAKVEPTSVYALGELVYGFGEGQSGLLELGFEKCTISLEDTPQLVGVIITAGLVSHLKKRSYELDVKFRHRAFSTQKSIGTIMSNVQLIPGFDFKPIFLKDKVDGALFFSIIIDSQFKLKLDGKSASIAEVFRYSASQKGEAVAHQVIRDIRVKIGDLTPYGSLNPESSRFRISRILEFVSEINDVTLYNGCHLRIPNAPLRIAEASA